MINIIAILAVISSIVVFIYIYVVPWSKGTFVSDDSCETGWCKQGSYCCRDPRGDYAAYCLTKKCKNARLEIPTDNQVKFFNTYMIMIIIILVILIPIKYMLKNSK